MSGNVLSLHIRGMHCAACSARSQRTLAALPGVAGADVNLATSAARVELAPGASPAAVLEQAKAAIAGLGFEAQEAAPDEDMREAWASDEAEARQRLVALRARLLPMFALALPLLVLSMGHMAGMPLPRWLDPMHAPQAFALTQLALTAPMLWLGRDFYISGLSALRRASPNMDSLVAVGTGAAFVYSLWQTVGIVLNDNAMERAMDLYYESCAVLLAMIALGNYLEALSRRRATDAMGALMRLTPPTALLLEGEQPREIPVEDLRVEDRVLVKAGSRVPVDGTVLDGMSSVDMSLLTGESMPVPVQPGHELTGGSVNGEGVLTMRVTRVGRDTTLARIVRLVREAQGGKAPIARLADRVSFYFVPAVMLLALVSAGLWLTVGQESLPFALRIFVAVLVIACPCAMGLATPTSLMVATGRGAQMGVLIKNGAALEQAGRVTALALDKTGTLTTGKPRLTDVFSLGGMADNTLLRMALALETRSEHPLAQALLTAGSERGLTPLPVRDLEIVPGMGLRGQVTPEAGGEPVEVALGNRAFMGRLAAHTENTHAADAHAAGNTADAAPDAASDATSVAASIAALEAAPDAAPFAPPEAPVGRDADLDALLDTLADAGKTPLLLAVAGRVEGVLALADGLRPESASVVRRLRSMGLHVIMLSGDNRRTAQAVAREAGVDEVIAGVLPQGKEEAIADLQAQGYVVGMVGDGINDAPALARAHVGLVVGTGVDVSVEAGDIVLMRGGMEAVLTALALSRATLRNIRQNLFWAFGYNVLGLPVAAGLLHVFGGPTLSPMLAGTAMALSSTSVVLNALRLRAFRA